MKTVVDAYKEVELLIYLFRLFGFFEEQRAIAKPLDAAREARALTSRRRPGWVDWELGADDEAAPPAMPGVGTSRFMDEWMYERMSLFLSRMSGEQRTTVLSLYADSEQGAAERACVLVACCNLVGAHLSTMIRQMEHERDGFRLHEQWDDAKRVGTTLSKYDRVRGNVEWTRLHSDGITGKPTPHRRRRSQPVRGRPRGSDVDA